MTSEARGNGSTRTGISVMEEVPWGTHFCCFFETKQDLLDTLVPYFKTGLQRRESCLWVVTDPLSLEEARQALRSAVIDLDRHLKKGDIQIESYADWYLPDGRWDPKRVLQSLSETLDETLINGCAGLRASGGGGWVENNDWVAFRQYEKEIDALVSGRRSIVLCAYPLASSSGNQVFDVACIHQAAFAKRRGQWEIIETPEVKEAKAQIQRLNEELEKKIETRTTELRQVNKELKEANHQLRILSGRLFQLQEDERRHLARELHDEIGQALTAAKINTDVLRAAAPPDLCARLDENAAILDRLLQQTRQISLDLRPPVLDDLGLVAALRWHVDQQAKRAGLLAKFSADSRADEASADIQTACFRLAQEAITNAIRHAGATDLTVELRRRDSSLSLVVQDDGVGFDVAEAEARAAQGASLGLIGLKERAALAGGRVRIVSSRGEGTTIEIRLPFQGADPGPIKQGTSASE